jgi:adenosine deaminase
MRETICLRSKLLSMCRLLCVLLLCAMTPQAQSPAGRRSGDDTPEQKTARYFESTRKSPPQQFAFLLQMPKGADLHNHLSGAVYAESYIQWAASGGLCLNTTTLALTPPPCDAGSGQSPASAALTNSILYRQTIDAWSMRYWEYSGQNGHDHFFDTFGKFGAATYGQTGRMLAETAARAARGHVIYLELMLTPDSGRSSQIGQKVGWDGNLQSTLDRLKASGISEAASLGEKALREAEVEKNSLLKCGTPQADPGCGVTIRYIFQVSRGSAPAQVYAQMVTGMMMADQPDAKVMALNLVQPEDSLASMQNFSLQMQMLNFLRPLYPRAHITLHAGELVPGVVPPDGLSFHIRDSVEIGHAERIGHGVDVMHETDPYGLLRKLKEQHVLIEICLTSNDVILGVRGPQHPLKTYLEYGVPVALATDDEGVSRSEISREYLKAAEEQGLGYAQLKMMARNSLEYAFIAGASLWADATRFVPGAQCSRDAPGQSAPSKACAQFLSGSEKARLQWELEREFREFESRY